MVLAENLVCVRDMLTTDKFAKSLVHQVQTVVDNIGYMNISDLAKLYSVSFLDEVCLRYGVVGKKRADMYYSQVFFDNLILKLVSLLDFEKEVRQIHEVFADNDVPTRLSGGKFKSYTDIILHLRPILRSGKLLAELYVPNAHILKLETQAISDFMQTGLISFDTFDGFGVAHSHLFEGSYRLHSVVISDVLFTEMISMTQEAIITGSWVDLSLHVACSSNDLIKLASLVYEKLPSNQTSKIIQDSAYIISNVFIQSARMDLQCFSEMNPLNGDNDLKIKRIQTANPTMNLIVCRSVLDLMAPQLKLYESQVLTFRTGSTSRKAYMYRLDSWKSLSRLILEAFMILSLNLKAVCILESDCNLVQELRKYSCSSSFKLLNMINTHENICKNTPIEKLINPEFNVWNTIAECNNVPSSRMVSEMQKHLQDFELDLFFGLVETYVVLNFGWMERPDVLQPLLSDLKSKIAREADSAMALHICISLMFAELGCMLDFSGRFIPAILKAMDGKNGFVTELIEIQTLILDGMRTGNLDAVATCKSLNTLSKRGVCGCLDPCCVHVS